MDDHDNDDELIYKIIRVAMVLLVIAGMTVALLLLCDGVCKIIDYILMT